METVSNYAESLVEQAYQEFINFLDSLMFEGYAQELAKQDPQCFQQQFNDFMDAYYGK